MYEIQSFILLFLLLKIHIYVSYNSEHAVFLTENGNPKMWLFKNIQL